MPTTLIRALESKEIGVSSTPVKRAIIIAIIIYLSYFIYPKYLSSGKTASKILEPSSGGIGIRLNTASVTFTLAAK